MNAAELLDAGYDSGFGVTSLDSLLSEHMSRPAREDFAAFLIATMEEHARAAALEFWLITRSAAPYRTPRHVAEEQWAAAWARHDSAKGAEQHPDADPEGAADREGR